MNKKILVAVDNSRPSKEALKYAVYLSRSISNLYYVLLYVQPLVSLFLIEEARRSASARKQLDKIYTRNADFANGMLAEYQAEMVSQGINADRIEIQTQPRALGYAKDIIDIAQNKQYDAILVGRRGLSGITKLYSGSVTTNILEQSQVIPVWLVDGSPPAGDLLLAVDGSEASLRMVDHVSYMLSGQSSAVVTLLHVTNSAHNYCEIDENELIDPELDEIVVRGDKACIDQFFPLAMKKFEQAGVDKSQVQFHTITGPKRIDKAIYEFAHGKDFSTVVIGRRGLDKSFFMGSVSRRLIDKLSNRALWVVT